MVNIGPLSKDDHRYALGGKTPSVPYSVEETKDQFEHEHDDRYWVPVLIQRVNEKIRYNIGTLKEDYAIEIWYKHIDWHRYHREVMSAFEHRGWNVRYTGRSSRRDPVWLLGMPGTDLILKPKRRPRWIPRRDEKE